MIDKLHHVPVVAAEQWWVEQSRRNIAQFMTYISDGQRRPATHHLEWLTNILDPKIKRLLIIAPRESAKTTIIVNTMAWMIGHFPNSTNVITSVSAKQTEERLDALKQLMELPRYNNVFPYVHMDKTKSYNKSEFTVWSERWPGSPKPIPYSTYRSLVASYGDIKNPTVRAAGITSSMIIGARFNGIALVDDPHDSENSATEDQCAKVEKYFSEYILGGVQYNGKVVVITTRWAELDLAGRLMERKTASGENVWKIIDIPCLDDQGNSYWPDYWPVKQLQEKREEVGEIMFQTMYMNNPIGASSGMFQPHHLTMPLPERLPEFERVVIGVDMAEAKTAGSDFTVAIAVARDKEKPFGYYVLNMIRGKWNFDEALSHIQKFADRVVQDYGRLDNIAFESPANKAHAQHLHELRPDLPVVEVQPKGQKEIRLSFVANKAQSGRFYINQHMTHIYAMKSELLGFPKAAHDDCCDALSIPLQLENWSGSGGSGLIEVRSPFLL